MDVERWRALLGYYPFPSVRIAEAAALVPLDYVIAASADIARYERLVGDDALTRGVYPRVAETGGFVAYALPNSPVPARATPACDG